MSSFLETRFGSAGPRVFRLGLSATYRPGRETVHRALDEGLNYFFFLGFDVEMTGVLRDVASQRRESYVLATGAYNLIWTHQNLARTLERRLRKLRTEYIDVFHFLGVTRRQYFTAQVREELAALREDPRVRAVSISCHDPVLAAELLRDRVLDAIMIRYNAANRDAEAAVFPAARDAGAGVTGYTATSWTQLLKRPPGWEGRVPAAGSCYRFVLSNPGVDVCLTAPRSLDEFEQNLREVRRGPLQPEELDEMRRFGDAVKARALPVPRHP